MYARWAKQHEQETQHSAKWLFTNFAIQVSVYCLFQIKSGRFFINHAA